MIIKNIIYATVIYPTKDFEIFLNDYLLSVFTQTTKNFELLIILDEVELAVVEKRVNKLNKDKIKVHIRKFLDKLNPIELRKKLVDISYELNADVLIFSDFDENVASNRVEEVIKNIDNFAFAFNDFYVVDKNLKKINKILEILKLDSLINNNPDGINMNIGEKGVQLSGGQVQRIALARAIYLDRPIIIMDEPTSALDTDVEKYLFDNIHLVTKSTLIIVSHKLKTFQKADIIYKFLEGGKFKKLKKSFKKV